MKVLNAMDLKKGAKAEHTRMFSVLQPLQFLPAKEKDEEWTAWNMDWLEWNGLKQIRSNARKLMKNYKLAEGIIDKSDYIIEENNEMKDIVEQLASNDEMESLELKFYPIIPNVVDTLVAEFAKRDKRITFRAVDEYTHNEILEMKRAEVEGVLVAQAEMRLLQDMIQMGLDTEDPEVKKMMEEKMNIENLKTLPEIQDFFSKDYEVIAEQWASKQHLIDEERFKMDELEEMAFKDKLITDREFWHFNMMEDDYLVELWNPVLTFYHKSPFERYISNAQFVGKIEIMSAADIIDTYGWKMTEEQLLSLQEKYLTDVPGYAIAGYQNDGTFYDATKNHDWNVGRPSLQYRQLMAASQFVYNGNDIIAWILSESEDSHYFNRINMFRVCTAYWKSQRKIGHLTKITETGEVTTAIITEEYKVTDKPIYNTSLLKKKTAQNLVFGEHIEWVWINQTWGGHKIGPNAPTMYGMTNVLGINPIYLGINQNKIAPLKFQFKGDHTLYGCKLPVEGRVFSDRNSKSVSLVDAMKPFQIGYNIVNNQISDILIDEIGTVIMLDQNTLPKHSLGEDWGKGNLAKAYVAMKDFSILPLDTSITNTENALNFQHFQQLDLSQTQRLMSRIQLSQFFKQQAFEQVGVSLPRMGAQIGAKVSATEVEQVQAGSYAQTEMHFVEHCDHLMPRVHQMRTDLAQWYHSTKSSIKLQYTVSNDERVNFEINGEELMLRDINVYATTKANHRRILEQMKAMAVQNNTTGASLYDIGKLMQTDSIGTLNTVLKQAEEKQRKQHEADIAAQREMAEAENQRIIQEKQMELDFKMREAEKDRRRDLLVAEIRASGYGAMQDLNQNTESDFTDSMNKMRETDAYEQTVNIQQQKVNQNAAQHSEKMDLQRQKLALEREKTQNQLEIARTNKNQYDFKNVANETKAVREKKSQETKKKK